MTPVTALVEQSAIEHACARIVLQQFGAMDDLRYDRVTAAFMPDGVWHRAGTALRGRAEILAAMNARDPSRLVRHVVTNIVVDVTSDREAGGRCYVTAYAGPASEQPPTINAPWLVLTATYRFVHDGDAWLIAESRIERDFVFSAQVD
jgi:hypothetical protein